MQTTESFPGGARAVVTAVEQWARVKRLFLAALEMPAEKRGAFLDAECSGDGAVRGEVECFLGAHERAGSFLPSQAFIDGSTISSAVEAAAGLSFAAGACVGPYEIDAVIGRGAMGEVYRARDGRGGRLVAIKVLPRVLARDGIRLGRFEQEVRAVSAISHANVVAVLDSGWHEGVPYLVTELLEGETLEQRLARGPLTLREALELARQIAGGLVAAHERGIVHRDLKPANLFLTASGQVKILDFGLAKRTHVGEGSNASRLPMRTTLPGMVLGTVGYMSPEQVRADTVDVRSDQFSFGCVLHEMLYGEPPFRRSTAVETMSAVLNAEPRARAEVDARVPRLVASVVDRCLAKDRAYRYASTGEIVRDLELAAGHLSRTRQSGLILMTGAALLAASVAAECRGVREAAGRALHRFGAIRRVRRD
jgi:serine/threonine protein kinase